ncbi:MAG: hypothetical protein ABWZ76_00175 [Acidimicrobiales bacterium]
MKARDDLREAEEPSQHVAVLGRDLGAFAWLVTAMPVPSGNHAKARSRS